MPAAPDDTLRDIPVPDVSIVIPVRDEAPNLEPLTDAIGRWIREEPRYLVEVIVVDDGSLDETAPRLRELVKRYRWLAGVELTRPLGKSSALRIGFQHARGRLIATMDGDLQDDPRELSCLLDEVERHPGGADLCVGWRRVRRDRPMRKVQSWLWNTLVQTVAPVELHDANCGLKAMRRAVAEASDLYGDRHRLLPVIAAFQGFRVGERPVLHYPRHAGRSKYGMRRLTAGVMDLIAVVYLGRYHDRPGHALGGIGLAAMGLGVLGVGATALQLGFAERPSLAVAVVGALFAALIGSGLSLLALGLIAEQLLTRSGATSRIGQGQDPVRRRYGFRVRPASSTESDPAAPPPTARPASTASPSGTSTSSADADPPPPAPSPTSPLVTTDETAAAHEPGDAPDVPRAEALTSSGQEADGAG